MKPHVQLLVEIGTEELPPSFLRQGVAELESRVRAMLVENEISVGKATLFYTPRRLAIRFDEVAPLVPARTVELQGPPKKAAFDDQGKPTRTAIGFSRAHGRTPEDLEVRTTPKGEYTFLSKELPALETSTVLRTELPGIIAAIPFPKTMRWREDKTKFARPIRWLLCLLGDEPVPFEFAGLTAGNRTHGHRGVSDKPIELPNAGEYETLLLAHKVIVDFEERRKRVEEETTRLAQEAGGKPVLDPELVEETVNITEFPVPILCAFNPEHLTLPAAVLITALKKHQRCFALRKQDIGPVESRVSIPEFGIRHSAFGNSTLLPRFVAVADTPDCDRKEISHWYEKAAESRLEDARFFFEADMKKGLEALVEREKQVVWVEGMGSYFDKTERLRALCLHLAAELPEADAALLDRAAHLSKADLLTDMVREKEFTSLQGIMGGTYARRQGEPDAVADAIAEQYLPAGAGGELPKTVNGSLLSIADKTDSITAIFLTGAIPTGSEDPFALRRQAMGIIAIVLERKLSIDLGRLIDFALSLFPDQNPEHAAGIVPFIQERLQARLAQQDIPHDIALAVMETTWHLPRRALAAARALLEFRSKPDFEKLIIGQKRVANILRDQDVSDGRPDPELFAEPAEKELFSQARTIEPDLDKAVKTEEFGHAFELLLGLRAAIDRLFDDVLVMAEDRKLRANRLQLLRYIRSLFRKLADLSRIVLEGETNNA